MCKKISEIGLSPELQLDGLWTQRPETMVSGQSRQGSPFEDAVEEILIWAEGLLSVL